MSGIPDAIAITNLLYRYAELIDAGDYEGHRRRTSPTR